MGLEEIRKYNEQIETKKLIWHEVRSLRGKTNIDKLKHFNFITEEREEEIQATYFKRYYLEKWEVKVGTIKDTLIDPKKIVGTRHSDYYERTLFESLNSLKRFESILAELIINPNYYTSNETRNNNEKKIDLAYKRHEDKYYINGEGNNRLITSVVLGFPKILINEITIYDESQEIKNILLWARENGFEYIIEGPIKNLYDPIEIKLVSDCIDITINGIEQLIIFKDKYERLDVSTFRMKSYKVKSVIINNYQDKYLYSNEINHLFHAKYLELREHKLKN
ncbi:hypothetical protein H7K06_24535 [Priestia aryabhattai]|uniref:hypothetical protein n=1 Tax=Priestia aryabhattai TaxID=412384 RepID=UPI001C8F0F52|nr:hypothetical protein [Priestia aryabhattai]MBX9970702.1 hypothetical protein [Priestia aryabhattai]